VKNTNHLGSEHDNLSVGAVRERREYEVVGDDSHIVEYHAGRIPAGLRYKGGMNQPIEAEDAVSFKGEDDPLI
jgi:hypothetical protein